MDSASILIILAIELEQGPGAHARTAVRCGVSRQRVTYLAKDAWRRIHQKASTRGRPRLSKEERQRRKKEKQRKAEAVAQQRAEKIARTRDALLAQGSIVGAARAMGETAAAVRLRVKRSAELREIYDRRNV